MNKIKKYAPTVAMAILWLATASIFIGVAVFFSAFYTDLMSQHEPSWVRPAMRFALGMIACGGIPLFLGYAIAVLFEKPESTSAKA